MKIIKYVIFAITGLFYLSDLAFSQVNQFTGDAVQSIPLASVGGVDVALSYNSNVRKLVYANNKDLQSGWVGLGWSLDLGSIEADINNSRDTTDDKYYYSNFDGNSQLVWQSGNEFRLKNYKPWKIYRKVDHNGIILGWTIIKEDGTIFRFGNIDTTTHSFSYGYSPMHATKYSLGWGNLISHPLNKYFDSAIYVPYKWQLSQIEYLNGTSTKIAYQQRVDSLLVGTKSTSKYYTQELHPYKIIDRVGNYLEFILDTMYSDEYTLPVNKYFQKTYENKYLKKIISRKLDNSVVTEIELSYYVGLISTTQQKKRFLASVIFKDKSGHQLPKYKMTYVAINGESQGDNYGALKSTVSPKGGKTEFTYKFQPLSQKLNFTKNYSYTGPSPSDSMKFLDSIGIGGSDFAALKLSDNKLEIYRWGAYGWYKDTLFPYSGTFITHRISNDFIAIKISQSEIRLLKRQDDGWKSFTINSTNIDTVGPRGLEILGVGPDYIAISHNNKPDPDYVQMETVSIFKYENENWNCSKLGTYQWGNNVPGTKVICEQNYFVMTHYYSFGTKYSGWIYDNMWKNIFSEVVDWAYAKSKNSQSSDYFTINDETIIRKWNGKTFSPISSQLYHNKLFSSTFFQVACDSTTSTTYSNCGMRQYPPPIFLAYGCDTITAPNYQYYIQTWKGDSLSSPISIWETENLNTKFYPGGSSLDSAVIALGRDCILTGWRKNGIGYVGIVNYKAGIWSLGNTLSFPGNEVNIFVRGENVIIALDTLSSYSHSKRTTLKHYKIQFDTLTYVSQLATLDGINDEAGLLYRVFSNNIFVDLSEKNTSHENKYLNLYRQGYGIENTTFYKGDTLNGMYVVEAVSTYDGMNDKYTTKYDYARGIYGDNMLYAKFNKVTTTTPGNVGKIETYYYNEYSSDSAYDFIDVYNFKKLDGSSYRTKSYNSSGVLISESKTIWSLRWVDSTIGISERRALLTESLIDGVKSIRKFEYNNSNGLVSKTTDSLFNVKTDRGNNQNIVTEIKYAFENHVTGMNSSGKNMLVYPFETKVYEKDANNTLILRSHKQTFYSPAAPYYVTSSKLFDSTQWIITDSIVSRNGYGNIVESRNIDGIITSTKWGHNSQVPVATIVNAQNSETAVESCEEFRTVGSGGSLALGFTEYTTLHNVAYSKAKTGVSGYSQKTVISQTTTGGTGLYVNMGTLDASTNYIIEFDYLVTQGSLQIYTSNGSGTIQATYAKETTPKWKHAKILWNLGGSASNWKIYFRNPYDGDVYWIASTFYLDNVRIYPADAFCTSQSYDPVTLQGISTTDINGVSSVVSYDNFGRATQIKH